ncbi:MAG: hypothetical protein IPM45_00270 [Acidimicrobiales bacterium]|nr:hypothetical protein [Acidimicrobiales bacterium]
MAFDPDLGTAFGFDADDLAANIAGRLSPDQEQLAARTVEVYGRQRRRSWVLLAVVFAVAVVALVVGIAVSPGGGVATAAVAGVALAWIASIVLYFMRRGRRTIDAYRSPRLRVAHGVLALSPTMSDSWVAELGDVTLPLDGIRALALEHDATYRAYYIDSPDGGITLSIERL